MLKLSKKFYLFLFVIGAIFTLTSCTKSENTYRIALDEKNYEVMEGESLSFTPSVTYGGEVVEKEVLYHSYNPEIASFEDGTLVTHKSGVAHVRISLAEDAKVFTTATVNVLEDPSLSVKFTYEKSMAKGTTQKIDYKFADEKKAGTITFSSMNSEIVKIVDENTLEALSEGTTTIVAHVASTIIEGSTRDYELAIVVYDHTYTISYVLNGGINDSDNPNQYISELLPVKLNNPTKVGYQFMGWYDNDRFSGKAISEIVEGTEGNITLYAKWQIIDYEITYELSGGKNSSNNPETYNVEKLPLELAAPTRVGYEFMGWMLDEKVVESLPKDLVGKVTLTATWQIIDYKITYELSGGKNSSNNPETYNVEKLPIELVEPTRAGYEFMGWMLAGKVVESLPKDLVGEITLVATWKVIDYTINYDLKDGVNNKANPKTYNVEQLPLELAEPTRAGYEFMGWMLDGKVIESLPKDLLEEVTLVATWKAIDYAITYELAGGKNSVNNPNTYNVESDFDLEDPTRDHYTFKGWFIDDVKVTHLAGEYQGPLTITAVWEPITYTITYDEDGGVMPEEYVTKFVDGDVVELPTPTKKGYEFVGWFEGKDQVTEIESRNYELVAHWDLLEYQINYHFDYGTWPFRPELKTFEDLTEELIHDFYVFVNPTETYHQFSKGEDGKYASGLWYTKYNSKLFSVEKKEIYLADNDDYFVNSPQYYPKWNKFFTRFAEYVTIQNSSQSFFGGLSGTLTIGILRLSEFLDNSANRVFNNDEVRNELRALVVEPVLPTSYTLLETVSFYNLVTPEGREFLGWYTTPTFSEGTKVTTTEGLEGNLDLYAKWGDLVEKDITYVLGENGELVGDAPKKYVVSEGIDLSSVKAAREGYNFTGWFTDVSCTKPITSISKEEYDNVTLYAGWEAILYDIEYNYDKGTLDAEMVDEKLYKTFDEIVAEYIKDYNKVAGTSYDDPSDFGTSSWTPSTQKWHYYVIFGNYEKWGWLIDYFYNNLDTAGALVKSHMTTYHTQGASYDYSSEETDSKNGLYTLFYCVRGFLQKTQYRPNTDWASPNFSDATILNNVFEYVPVHQVSTTTHQYSVDMLPFELLTLNDVPSGFKFIGWCRLEDCSDEPWLEIPTGTTGKLTLYAKYEEVDVNVKHTIEYKLDEGASLPDGTWNEYTVKDGLVLPIPIYEGHRFVGWSLNQEGTNFIDKIEPGSEDDYTLYGIFYEETGTLMVGSSQTYKTLKDAVAAAKPGDIIVVEAGTYSDSFTISVADLTILGPNASIDPTKGVRKDEAIITGKITVATTASNLTINGLAFTAGGSLEGATGNHSGLTFINNKVYDITVAATPWKNGSTAADRYNQAGFLDFAPSSSSVMHDFVITNNSFTNIEAMVIYIGLPINLTVSDNTFKDFGRDAVRVSGGHVSGDLVFTNNTFEQTTKNHGYNAIYTQSLAGNSNSALCRVFIENNTFKQIGTDKETVANGVISAFNFQEHTTEIYIRNNVFDHCQDYIYLRNNAGNETTWKCEIENNQFLGLPNAYYYANLNGTTDSYTSNPKLAVFKANYYEDNEGAVIKDLTTYAEYFEGAKTAGTALETKPTTTNNYLVYITNGGSLSQTFVTYDASTSKVVLPAPTKAGYRFVGWTKADGTFVDEIAVGTKGTIILFAKWWKVA